MSLAMYLNAKPAKPPVLDPGKSSGAIRRVTFLTPEDTAMSDRNYIPKWMRNGVRTPAQKTARDRMIRISEYVKANGPCSARQISRDTGICRATALDAVRVLVEVRMIEMIGESFQTRYTYLGEYQL